MMTFRRIRRNGLAAACLSATVMVLGACGGGGHGRPSTDDLSKALRDAGDNSLLGDSGIKLDQKSADCMAKALRDSGISDKALQAIVEGDQDYQASEDDQKAASATASAMQECITAPAK